MHIKDYCIKYPKLSNTQLAELIAEAEGYKAESVRTRVRYYRGVHGYENRKFANKELSEDYKLVNLNLHYKEKQNLNPFNIKGKKILVLADIHIPTQDNNAIKTALEYAKEIKCDSIVILGDVLDFSTISKFTIPPNSLTVQQEVDIAKQLLGHLRFYFRDNEIIFKEGNHEARIQLYLYRIAKELADVKNLQLSSLLGLKELGIEYVKDYRLLKAGKLFFAHGQEFKSCPSVNIARRMYERVHVNLIFGHLHKTESYTDVNPITREFRGSFSVGCLCNVQPEYMQYSKHNQGFAVVTIANNGDFKVDNKTIIKGNVV